LLSLLDRSGAKNFGQCEFVRIDYLRVFGALQIRTSRLSEVGVFNVISSFVTGLGRGRCFGWFAIVVLAAVAGGCGPTNSAGTSSETSGAAKLVKEEDLYTYEGKGAAKRKVEVSRRERVKLIHEAAKKSD
jgi:hypothetical protein